jgi:hypothetical protein
MEEMDRNDRLHEISEEVSNLGAIAAQQIKDGFLREAAETLNKAQLKAEEATDWMSDTPASEQEEVEAAVSIFVEAFDEVYRMLD